MDEQTHENEPINQMTLDRGFAALVDAITVLEKRVAKLEELFHAQNELNKRVQFILTGHQGSVEALAQHAGIETTPKKPSGRTMLN